jgi:hypothetical protein
VLINFNVRLPTPSLVTYFTFHANQAHLHFQSKLNDLCQLVKTSTDGHLRLVNDSSSRNMAMVNDSPDLQHLVDRQVAGRAHIKSHSATLNKVKLKWAFH